jgi:hypothetical protein
VVLRTNVIGAGKWQGVTACQCPDKHALENKGCVCSGKKNLETGAFKILLETT